MSRSKIPASLRLPSSAARHGAVAGFVSTLGLAMAGAPMMAAAQTPPPKPPEQLPPVTVSGDRAPGDYKTDTSASPKLPVPLIDTPKSVVIIPKELIKEQGATSLRDVLRTTPGISLSTSEGGLALGDRIVIRGFEARGDIFVDGMRDPGVISREAFDIEQVEILKGPGSAYTGRGATGGSINIITKQPFARNMYAADVTGGTDNTKRITVDVNQKVSDSVAFRVNGMWHDADVAGRDEVFQKRWGIAPSITFGLGTPTTVTLSYYHLSTDELPDYGHPFNAATQQPLRVDRDNFYGLTGRDFRKTTADVGNVLFEHRFNDDIKVRSQFRFGVTTNDYVASAPENPNVGAGTVSANAKSRNSWNKAFGNQTDVTVKFDTGTAKHTLIAGFEISREISRNRPYAIVPVGVIQDIFNPGPNQPWLGTVVPGPTFTKFTADTKAIYVFDSVKLNESIDIMGGLRLDNYKIRSKANQGNAVNGLKNNSTFLNWQLGAVYKPVPYGSVYVAFASSSNPSGEQFDGGAADGGLAAASAPLNPERNLSYEVGTKWDLMNDKLSLTAALFRIDKTNARVALPGAGATVLAGKQRVEGIELGAIGRVTPEWSVFGGLTVLDARVTKSPVAGQEDAKLPNVPGVTFSLWTTYRITEKLTIGGLAFYSGKRYGGTFGAGTANVPGYWRFDAMASYKITENVEVRLNVLNITNKLYYDAIYRNAAPFAFVGLGRSALLTTSFKF